MELETVKCNLFDLLQFTLVLFVHLRIGTGYIIGEQEDKFLPTLSLSTRQLWFFSLSSE